MYSQTSHIPQPPHSAGLAYKGLRAAIDPLQIPSPIDAIEADREQWESEAFLTLPGSHIPLSTTDYVAVDQGNSSPKFLRFSTGNVPSTSRLASECEIPLVAVIQPFADQDPREEPVPLVDTGDLGPARCEHCRAYINPWCKWVSGGTKWECNLCSHETEVLPEYFCNLDANLLRLDHLQRPELNKGTVDFIVSDEYFAPHPPPRITPLFNPTVPLPTSGTRSPQPMNFVFAFDVSQEGIRSGLTKTACAALTNILYPPQQEDGTSADSLFPPQSKIAIITFDSTLHFYDLGSHLDRADLLIVPDIDEPFVPLYNNLFVDPAQSKDIITKALEDITTNHEHTHLAESALGSLISAGLSALAGVGGKLVVFTSTLPTVGLGALTVPPNEQGIYDTDKERALFAPRNDFWPMIAEQCAEQGVGVDMFLGMGRPIDIGSIGVVSSITGGELFFHPRFEARDAGVLASQLTRLVSRTTGYNCTLRVRCSKGLRVVKHYGNFNERSATDLEFGTVDADKAIAVSFELSGSLDERQYAFVQSALLYTSADGQRRVRMCNLALQVAALAGNVFRFADMDTVVCHMLREAMSKIPSQKIPFIQEQLTEKGSAILLAYRKNCAASASPTQLIIPEAFRALVVYILGMMKTKPLKGRNITADVRNFYIHRLMAMGVRSTMQHLYPRLLALHDLSADAALPDPTTGVLVLPALMRDSHLFMEAHGVYLIDNEEQMVLWLGSSVSPQLLQDLLGVDDIMQVDPQMVALPVLPTLISTQVRNILAHRYAQRGRTLRFRVARQNLDAAEIEFADMLVEDQNNAAMSYLDYLCLVHKQINTALTTGASISGTSGFRTPW